MPDNTNSGQGNGPLTRSALLSLLEVHTEGATATELGSYLNRHRESARAQLVLLKQQGKVHQTLDHLWHLSEPEAAHRASLTPATSPSFPLRPARTRSR